MIAVALSLLPALGALLYAMDRIEDRLSAGPPTPRHAKGRHLRLVPDAAPSRTEHSPSRTEHSPAEQPAQDLDAA
ncbi:hypothetical protein [Streptomyces sp. NPDC058307]|uniref:hypothetical protein n=1 Tax=Streptomyces sp. NPDC058307 TaxID=3346439 RepID=UPI0036EACDA3